MRVVDRIVDPIDQVKVVRAPHRRLAAIVAEREQHVAVAQSQVGVPLAQVLAAAEHAGDRGVVLVLDAQVADFDTHLA